MRKATTSNKLTANNVAEYPLETADWVIARLSILGGEAHPLTKQIGALKDAALLQGEYPELEAALTALPTGSVSRRLLAKHSGTGKYMAAKLGWTHKGRTPGATGPDAWSTFLQEIRANKPRQPGVYLAARKRFLTARIGYSG